MRRSGRSQSQTQVYPPEIALNIEPWSYMTPFRLDPSVLSTPGHGRRMGTPTQSTLGFGLNRPHTARPKRYPTLSIQVSPALQGVEQTSEAPGVTAHQEKVPCRFPDRHLLPPIVLHHQYSPRPGKMVRAVEGARRPEKFRLWFRHPLLKSEVTAPDPDPRPLGSRAGAGAGTRADISERYPYLFPVSGLLWD